MNGLLGLRESHLEPKDSLFTAHMSDMQSNVGREDERKDFLDISSMEKTSSESAMSSVHPSIVSMSESGV